MFHSKNKILIILSLLTVAMPNSYAEEKKLPVETTYSLSAGSSEVSTVVRNDKSKEELIKDYIFPKVAEALKKVPQVSNVIFVPGAETKEEYSWANYMTMKRQSFAYVNLNLTSQVSLLFKVTEELRKCKATVEKKVDSGDEWGAGSTDCTVTSLKSEVVVEGPIAVYGTFVSNVDVDSLLKEKQKLTVAVKTNYSQEFEMESTFTILSSSFEESLMKFFDIFQVKSAIEEHFTRRQLLVGVARAMRNINERVLEL